MGLRQRVRRSRHETTVRAAYRDVLGREVDPDGLTAHVAALGAGMSPDELRYALASSPEGRAHRGLREPGRPELPDLTRERPERYHVGVDLHHRPILTFDVEEAADFDWLERRIVETGYYDHDGVWTLDVDLDKQLMAELLATLQPHRALELGCSSGAVLAGLVERGVDAVGVDVSERSKARALPSVRDRIVIGDVLTIDLDGGFDLVAGLDVFEHLNPNRIDAYLGRLAAQLGDGGWCVANIPVYGTDPVFGNVFVDYLAEPTPATLIHRIHVDDRGYPLHGHLIWATWDWWVDRFAAAGLVRQPHVESAVQARYGTHWAAATPARQSLFVFRRPGGDDGQPVVEALQAPSAVLSEHARRSA
jgi:SAM-dependent methyltransferase